jgi:N-acyl homoserine lactone hydrolase
MSDEVTWTIEPVCFGEFPALERSAFTYMRGFGEKFSAPSIGFVLKSELATVLVDTGPGDQSGDRGLHSPWTQSPEQQIEAALRSVGVEASELEHVVLSHLHYDHSSNLHLFPRARFIVQAEELRTAVDPIRPQKGMYEFGYEGFLPSWMEASPQLELVRGDVTLFPGLDLMLLPGHTPGLQGVRVRTAAGPHIIAVDLVSVQDNWGLGGPDDWVAPGIHVDLAACERSFERIQAERGRVLASHDWRTFDHPVYPEV